MNVVVHGCYNTRNFGDLLLLDLLAKHLSCVWSASVSTLRCQQAAGLIYCKPRPTLRSALRPDLAIFGGGGYLHDGDGDATVTKRLLRYSLPARFWSLQGVPVAMIAPGAGPWGQGIGARRIRQTLNACSLITIRDQESADFLSAQCGVAKQDMQVTADLVLAMSRNDIPVQSTNAVGKQLGEKCRKRLGLHLEVLTQKPDLLRRFMQLPVFKASSAWDEWEIVFFFDNTNDGADAIRQLAGSIPLQAAPVVLMQDHWETAALIASCDAVVTTKLHAGITAAALGIPCFGYSFHPKTGRFYRQIGRSEFQTTWEENPVEVVDSWIDQLVRGKRVHNTANAELQAARLSAKRNLTLLDEFVVRRRKAGPRAHVSTREGI